MKYLFQKFHPGVLNCCRQFPCHPCCYFHICFGWRVSLFNFRIHISSSLFILFLLFHSFNFHFVNFCTFTSLSLLCNASVILLHKISQIFSMVCLLHQTCAANKGKRVVLGNYSNKRHAFDFYCYSVCMHLIKIAYNILQTLTDHASLLVTKFCK